MITPTVLIVLSVFLIFSTSLMSWALSEKKGVISEAKKTKALQVAEAGLSYYKWHLAHNGDDYKNGETWCCVKEVGGTDVYYDELSECDNRCGPYTMAYEDSEDAAVGEYALTITPYPYGSTLMEVESKGKISGSGEEKTVAAKMGKRSLSAYALLSDTDLWIGKDETIIGPVHSNSGVRFDNTCSAEVTSAVESYKCGQESCWDMFTCDAGNADSFWDYFNEEINDGLWNFFGGTGGDFWDIFDCEGQACESFFGDCNDFDGYFHCENEGCNGIFDDGGYADWIDDYNFTGEGCGSDPCADVPTGTVCSYDCSVDCLSNIHGFCPPVEYQGDAIEMPGIWGLAGSPENDPLICQAYWKVGVPKIDFDLFAVDMNNIKDEAKTANGIYLPPVLLKQKDIDKAVEKGLVPGVDVAAEPGVGYRIVFKADGTLDVYIVKSYDSSELSKVRYKDGNGWKFDQEKIGTLSAATNRAMPENGLIFVEDDVWVEGTVRGAATIAASNFVGAEAPLDLPFFAASKNQRARITINDNILYTARDGSDVLGLMAEGDVLIPQYAPSNLEIDAVMLSQNGHVFTRNVAPEEEVIKEGTITVYGGIITYRNRAWNYMTEGVLTEGYRNTTTEYDEHLTYSPPPGFPTEDNYEILSWTEE